MDDKDAAQKILKFIDCPLGKYQHYKGPFYWVFATSIDEATLAPLVHYESLTHGTCWTRTIDNFTEKVQGVPRFKYVGGEK